MNVVDGKSNFGVFQAAIYYLSDSPKGSGENVGHRLETPLYRTDWNVGLNELPYARVRVTTIPLGQIANIAGPAWIAVPIADAHVIIERKRGQIKSVRAFSQLDLLWLN